MDHLNVAYMYIGIPGPDRNILFQAEFYSKAMKAKTSHIPFITYSGKRLIEHALKDIYQEKAPLKRLVQM